MSFFVDRAKNKVRKAYARIEELKDEYIDSDVLVFIECREGAVEQVHEEMNTGGNKGIFRKPIYVVLDEDKNTLYKVYGNLEPRPGSNRNQHFTVYDADGNKVGAGKNRYSLLHKNYTDLTIGGRPFLTIEESSGKLNIKNMEIKKYIFNSQFDVYVKGRQLLHKDKDALAELAVLLPGMDRDRAVMLVMGMKLQAILRDRFAEGDSGD